MSIFLHTEWGRWFSHTPPLLQLLAGIILVAFLVSLASLLLVLWRLHRPLLTLKEKDEL